MQKNKTQIAIIGGGIAGSSVALYLSQFDLDITLFEKESSLVSGPPMCHLHAGGNLYKEIDEQQCIKLLKQSIELLRFYPHAVDFRPTLLVTPTSDNDEADILLQRLKLLQSEYQKLIDKNQENKVLGESCDYYKLYSKEDIIQLRKQQIPTNPKTLDDWIIPITKELTLEKLKFPLILVQEYGLNVFRIAASASLLLREKSNITLKTDTFIKNIKQKENTFIINEERFDYLINAAGFRSGMIDDLLNIKRERLVEFKAAYIAQWKTDNKLWPEVIFYGKRGTPKGMAQFTPYPGGYFQLHGMTRDITLFENGLVKNSPNSAKVQLPKELLTKIEKGWQEKEIKQRTKRAIKHVSQYIPSFKEATTASKPLYGAQQIPGDDITLRASEVSFECKRYARCEIVKASSILTMADAITKKLIDLGLIKQDLYGKRDFSDHLNDEVVTEYAKKLCIERNYPESLAYVNYGVRERI